MNLFDKLTDEHRASLTSIGLESLMQFIMGAYQDPQKMQGQSPDYKTQGYSGDQMPYNASAGRYGLGAPSTFTQSNVGPGAYGDGGGSEYYNGTGGYNIHALPSNVSSSAYGDGGGYRAPQGGYTTNGGIQSNVNGSAYGDNGGGNVTWSGG